MKAVSRLAFRDRLLRLVPSLRLGMPFVGAAASRTRGRAAKSSISSQRLETRFENAQFLNLK
ncbi:MAG: hypothetical protein ACYTXC_07400 [Nostoc sp.]